MAFIRSLYALSIAATLILRADAGRLPAFRHEAVPAANKRQETSTPVPGEGALPASENAATAAMSVLTMITPSPGGPAVYITMQSQPVTTYIPEYTVCPLSVSLPASTPLALSAKPTYLNNSMPVAKRASTSGDGCSTHYSTTVIPVCATVLSGLVQKYTVSECNQYITFSSEFGYRLITASPTPANVTAAGPSSTGNVTALITPAPKIQLLTSYYVASWQALTSAGAPENVDVQICSNVSDIYQCSTVYERWSTTLVPITHTSTHQIDFTTTIFGPSQVIVEALTANVTESSTLFAVSTEIQTLRNATSTQTSKATRSATTGSTIYVTKTLEEVSSSATAASGSSIGTGSLPKSTSTLTLFMTSTVYAGTTTVRVPGSQTT